MGTFKRTIGESLNGGLPVGQIGAGHEQQARSCVGSCGADCCPPDQRKRAAVGGAGAAAAHRSRVR